MLCPSIDPNWFGLEKKLHFTFWMVFKICGPIEGQGIRFLKPFLVQTNFPKYGERKSPFN